MSLLNCSITGGITTIVFPREAVLAAQPDPRSSSMKHAFQLRYGTGPPASLTTREGSAMRASRWCSSPRTPASSRASPTTTEAHGRRRADGLGATLEAIDLNGDFNDPANWRGNREYGGSPGAVGTGPLTSVVINEVLCHSDPPLKDFVEHNNVTGAAINIGCNWIITDDLLGANITRYRIPRRGRSCRQRLHFPLTQTTSRFSTA
ncbi:MAG: hypothetical protein U1F87_10020 [Kiritimatiellia bacterium]